MKSLLFMFCLGLNLLQAQDKEWLVSIPNEPALNYSNLSNTFSFRAGKYLCWIRHTGTQDQKKLYMYNGASWTSLQMDSLVFIIQDIDEQNDSIVYIGTPYNLEPVYVMLHTNNAWKKISKLQFDPKNYTGISKMKFYKNKLYCINLLSNLRSALIEYDFKTDVIKTVATFQQKSLNDVYGYYDKMELDVHDNRLYVSGAYDSADNKPAQGYGYYDGSKFTPLNIFPASPVNYSLVKALDNDIFVVQRFYTVTSNDLKKSKMFLVRHDSLIADISGNLYTELYKNTGLGYMVHSFFQVYRQNGNIHFFAKELGHYEYDISNKRWFRNSANFWDGAAFFYKNKSYVFSSEARLPYAISGKCCVVMKTTPYVSGYAYADMDGDCSKSANDTLLRKTWVKLQNSGALYGALTNNNGWYEVPVEKGKYTYINGAPVFSNATCNNDTITVDSIRQYNKDISFSFLPPYNSTGDISVKIGNHSLLRRGQNHKISIILENLGKPDVTVKPKLRFDPRFKYISSSVNPSSSSKQSIEFYAIKVNKFKQVVIEIEFLAHQDSFEVADSVNFIVTIDSSGSEVDTLNNTAKLNERVIGPFDPNRITADVEGQVSFSPHHILYTVEFQNLGSDTAFNVRITDTIPSALDISKVELLSSSSKDVSAWLTGSLLTFKLNDVKLPPKTQNEAESKGYITFIINLKNNLSPGQSIRNKAGIYFDYEKEVPTNISSVLRVNNVTSVASTLNYSNLPFTAYPNPTSNTITIKTKPGSQIEKVTFHNISGQELFAQSDSNGNYDISTWPSGLFTITIRMNGRQYTSLNSKL